MAKEDKLSHRFIIKHLKEDPYLYPHSKAKLDYFCRHILRGYKEYKKVYNIEAGPLTYFDFAKITIERHNTKFVNETEQNKKNYYKQEHYLSKIINDLINSHVSKGDLDHAFTFINPIDDMRIDKLKEIIDGYYQIIKNDQDTFLKEFSLRIIHEFISGVRLLSMANYNDSLIIWRSLLETVAYYKILLSGGQKTINLYLTRKQYTKKIIGLEKATREQRENIEQQTENRNKRKSARWWEKQRFQWMDTFFTKQDDLSMKNVFEKINLSPYYPHYQIASLFTHEYLLDESDFKTISLVDYLINLYWKVFEEVRDDFLKLFDVNKKEINHIQVFEKEMRKLMSSSREVFNEFTNNLN